MVFEIFRILSNLFERTCSIFHGLAADDLKMILRSPAIEFGVGLSVIFAIGIISGCDSEIALTSFGYHNDEVIMAMILCVYNDLCAFSVILPVALKDQWFSRGPLPPVPLHSRFAPNGLILQPNTLIALFVLCRFGM